MGARYPDLNRCNYLYKPGDRRCLNPIETPGAPLCYWHRRINERQRDQAQRRAINANVAARHRFALDAYLRWLTEHPLVTATNIHLAMYHVHLLVAAGTISTREASFFLNSARELRKSYKGIRWEKEYPEDTAVQITVAREFIREFREHSEPAIAADRQAELESAHVPGEEAPTLTEELNDFPPPVGPALTLEDYARNQEEFFAGVSAQQLADAQLAAQHNEPAPPSPATPVSPAPNPAPSPAPSSSPSPARSSAPPHNNSGPPRTDHRPPVTV